MAILFLITNSYILPLGLVYNNIFKINKSYNKYINND